MILFNFNRTIDKLYIHDINFEFNIELTTFEDIDKGMR